MTNETLGITITHHGEAVYQDHCPDKKMTVAQLQAILAMLPSDALIVDPPTLIVNQKKQTFGTGIQ